MKWKVYLLLFLFIKANVATAMCQSSGGAEDSCCSEQMITEPCTDETADFPLPVNQSSEDGDCHCPGCHIQVVQPSFDVSKEYTQLVFLPLFLWKDEVDQPIEKSVFHPPCC